MWRCSCVLSSCQHHRDAPQCNKHVLWGERRLLWPGMAKNICLKCAAQYCSCTSSTCAAHPGSSCARCRQGGPLCHACSRGGVDVCLCGGCASCGHAACQNLARLAYRSGGKNALCLPCAEHVLLALAAQQGIELGIAGAGEDLLKAHLQDAAGVELWRTRCQVPRFTLCLPWSHYCRHLSASAGKYIQRSWVHPFLHHGA